MSYPFISHAATSNSTAFQHPCRCFIAAATVAAPFLFINSALASLNCTTQPTCSELGYSTSNVDNCEHYLYCPFDTAYKKCVKETDTCTDTGTGTHQVCSTSLHFVNGECVETDLNPSKNCSDYGFDSLSNATCTNKFEIYYNGSLYNTCYSGCLSCNNFDSLDALCADLASPENNTYVCYDKQTIDLGNGSCTKYTTYTASHRSECVSTYCSCCQMGYKYECDHNGTYGTCSNTSISGSTCISAC